MKRERGVGSRRWPQRRGRMQETVSGFVGGLGLGDGTDQPGQATCRSPLRKGMLPRCFVTCLKCEHPVGQHCLGILPGEFTHLFPVDTVEEPGEIPDIHDRRGIQLCGSEPETEVEELQLWTQPQPHKGEQPSGDRVYLRTGRIIQNGFEPGFGSGQRQGIEPSVLGDDRALAYQGTSRQIRPQ